MKTLSAAELVTVWEHTVHRSPVQQALGLLNAVFPECSMDRLARLEIGQRDALLLTLRERLFGSDLSSVVGCPRCQQPIELSFKVSDLRVEPAALAGIDSEETALTLTRDGYRVDFRVPNSLDLAVIETITDAKEAGRQMLSRCIQSVVGTTGSPADAEMSTQSGRLPESLLNAVAEHMAEADPQADTRLALRCPECHHTWSATFDIATYLIKEIQRYVKHLLEEVHHLARAYGWREADILAMTPMRRRAYLQMLGLA